MFLFRWIKNLILLAMLVVGLWWASGHFKYEGKTYQEWAIQISRSPVWQEASKDFRTWLGQFLQGAGKKIEEGVTADDQKKLDAIIQGDVVKRSASASPEAPRVKSSPIPIKK
jgi:hypothetical protein